MSTNCMKCGKPDGRTQPYGYCSECSKPHAALDALKASMHFEDAKAVMAAAYDAGFKDGITCYSWMKDGVTYVGTAGRTLVSAVEMRKGSGTYTLRI